MKTLIETNTNLSVRIYEDSNPVKLTEEWFENTDEDELILDRNSSNSVLIEDVTPPEDWDFKKYSYTAKDGWVKNLDYEAMIGHTIEEQAQLRNPDV